MTRAPSTSKMDARGSSRTAPMRLGVVTIGQAPRTDLTPELEALLPGAQLVERGVLDGLTGEEIDQLGAVDGEHTLTTRLSDGGSAVIGESAVMDRLPALLAQFEPEVDAILLACTGPFPRMELATPFFVPDAIISHAVAAAAPTGRGVGIICPLPEQASDTLAKFSRVLGPEAQILVEPSSPYTGDERDLRRAARALADGGARLIALDCFGYTAAMRAVVAAETGLPVIVARSVAARLAAEVLGLTQPLASAEGTPR